MTKKSSRALDAQANPASAVDTPRKLWPILDVELLKWIVSVEKAGLGLSGHLIQFKAEKIRNDLLLTELSFNKREHLGALKFS